MLATNKILCRTERANNIFFPSNCIIFQNDTKKVMIILLTKKTWDLFSKRFLVTLFKCHKRMCGLKKCYKNMCCVNFKKQQLARVLKDSSIF